MNCKSSSSGDYEVQNFHFWGARQKLACLPEYLGICWSSLHQIFRDGRHMCRNDRSNICFVIHSSLVPSHFFPAIKCPLKSK